MPRNEAYDDASGQVFAESTVSAQSMIPKWMTKSTGKLANPSTHRHSGIGSASLYNIALRVCLWNAASLTSEVLVDTGMEFAERIYKGLKNEDALTLRIWTNFKNAFPESTEFDQSYRIRIPAMAGSLPLEMGTIQRQLTLLSSSSLSNLHLRNLRVRYTHLMTLLDIPNLAVLVLEQDPLLGRAQSDDGIDDGFMRRWGLAVHEQRAFTKLRVIVFRHFQPALRSTLLCFSMFPELTLCNLGSWRVEQDMKGKQDGEAMTPRWQHLPTEGVNAHAQGKNPEKIWKRADKTIHSKMSKLFDLASILLPRPEIETLRSIVLSIDYGGTSYVATQTGYSVWFIRVLPSADEPTQLVKRPGESDGTATGKNNGTSKKRRVREGKKKEIGSLLGAFI